MKIWVKAVRIFHFRAHDDNESLRHHGTLQHMRFCKENHTIDQGEATGTITGTEPENEMKYREEIENAYNELVNWKINIFDLPKGAPGKASQSFDSYAFSVITKIFK